MKVTTRGEWYPGRPGYRDYGQRGGDIVVETFGRWIRGALYVGTPPGSHIGLWRTRTGTVGGLNLRVGRRYIGPCLTVFIHTRSLRERVEATG
jgi:hypothetical protein